MSAPGRVAVIIPNYNGERLLPACLDALAAQTYRDFTTTVVDNGSRDGSIMLCERRYPGVKIIREKENLGFAAAVNDGIRQSSGELVALLNNDTEAAPEWLGELVGALDRRPEFAFCASKMLDFHDRSIIDSAGTCYALNGRSIPRGFLAPDTGEYEREEEVFGACAGAALYRRSLFEAAGLFDESFVSYKEDVDLDFRARLRGLRCLYVPQAICHHIGGATSGRRKSDFAVRLSARNSITTFVKNMPRRFLPRALTLMLADQLFQACYQMVRGRQAVPLLGGIMSALGELPRALRERRRIQAGACCDAGQLGDLFRQGGCEVVRYRRRCRAAAKGFAVDSRSERI